MTSLAHIYYAQAGTNLEECFEIVAYLLEKIDHEKNNQHKMFELLKTSKDVVERLRTVECVVRSQASIDRSASAESAMTS